MANNMALNYNESTQCVENRHVRIRPRGFGGTDGLSVVNPDDAIKYKLFHVSSFGNLGIRLVNP